MDSADLCYVGCPTCPCPEVSAYFVKDICQSEDDLKTILDANYAFKLKNSDVRQNQTCIYQARVSIYGDNELIVPLNVSYDSEIDLCEGTGGEGFSDVFQIEFPGEIELMSEISEFKNYAFDGYYEKIEITINIFRNTSNKLDSTECDDYTPAEKEDCIDEEESESNGSTDPCDCIWKIKSDEISYEHNSDYKNETCKIPRCYGCGHDVTASALVEQKYLGASYEPTDEDEVIKSYFLPTVYPFCANYDAEYNINGNKVVKSVDIVAAKEYRPQTETTNVYETTMYASDLGIEVSETDEIEVEVNKGKSDCECDCIFGWTDRSGSKYQVNYVPENTNNEELVSNEINYYNCLCALGNCKLPNEENELEPVNWFRFSLNLGNLLKNKYGHNCKYELEVSLRLGSSEVYTETLSMDLSKVVKGTSVDERNKIKDYTIEKTIKLNKKDVSSSGAVFKVCAVSGISSVNDGYTDSPNSSVYDCNCCQEYDSSYFNDYIEKKPKKCIPCSKSDVVDEEKLLAKKYDQFYYNADMTGTFLMYANFSVNGKEYRKLVGNGTNESYEHNVYIDDITSESISSTGTSVTILHDS